jgi:hypothetical protein
MKRFHACLAVWFASLAGVFAQITVEVVPAQDQYLPDEALAMAVRITNLSGQTLNLGADNNWLKFSVESKDDFIVSKLGDVPVEGPFVLASSKVAIKRVDLAPYYSLTRAGHYSVTATLQIPGWDQQFTSEPASFDVIDGTKLWEQDFGVPLPPGAPGGEPEVRKYTLQQANYLKHLKMYVRVSDASDTRVFRVQALGTMVSFSQPEEQLDKVSNLHVLWQTGARGFAYRIVNPDGDILVRQTYDYTDTRPKLRMDESGQIVVVGGMRRYMQDDLPAGEMPLPALASTNTPAQPTDH